jgi:hypothetical protein
MLAVGYQKYTVKKKTGKGVNKEEMRQNRNK